MLLKDVNVRSETIELLEENIGSIPLTEVCLRNGLFRYVSGKGNKNKINKWDDSKLKHFCTVKGTNNKHKVCLLNGIYLIKG